MFLLANQFPTKWTGESGKFEGGSKYKRVRYKGDESREVSPGNFILISNGKRA